MAHEGPSSSSSFNHGRTYDVYVSFSGDTRYSFTGNLCNALDQKRINTFKDDKDLKKGEVSFPDCLKAMEESRIAIIVFSENYASSVWCLDELVKIIVCMKEKEKLVFPVFYNVDPSDVRHQRGSYGRSMTKHEADQCRTVERLQNWRLALREASILPGWHFKNGYEFEFIQKITKEISSKLNHRFLHIGDYPVGLKYRTLEVMSLLSLKSNKEAFMVGIHGIGGIGKTAIARAVYNSIAYQFDGSCFLAAVRENSMMHGLVQLQETLLLNLLGEKNIKLGNVFRGIPILENRLRRKKVLLVLDDVDNLNQVNSLARKQNWFGYGSRIIITTRNKHLLISHGIEKLYEVKELNDHEALELLSWNAFKRSEPDPRYIDIAKLVVQYARGLPLSLKVIGFDLFGKTIEEWKCTLKKYERPSKEILHVLKVSYDSLDTIEKEIFLDIACFFNGNLVEDVEKALDASYSYAKIAIRVLIDKSLLTIDETNRVKMHIFIQELGRDIAQENSPFDPSKRRRLWHHEDVLEVLTKNTGMDAIEGIMLDIADLKQEVHLTADAFKNFPRLRIVIFRNAQDFGTPKHLLNNLRLLQSKKYPLASLLDDFLPQTLVAINMPHSHLTMDQQFKACFSEGTKCLSTSLTVLQWPEYPSSCLSVDFHPTKLIMHDLEDSCLQSLEPVKELGQSKAMAYEGPSSSSSFNHEWTYEVFVSFSRDTRYSFTGNLCNALHQKGINTFKGDPRIMKSENIFSARLRAMEESRMAVIVFSKNYAYSSWCLDELVKIIDCMKEKGQLVCPVFYNVDPSDVRHQRGIYGRAIAEHEEKLKNSKKIVHQWRLTVERVHNWRVALREASYISGWNFKNWLYEFKFIQSIIEDICSRLNHTILHIADYPVGLKYRTLEVMSLLNLKSDNEVFMLGIHGIGGIGKTTIARAVYSSIAKQFEGSCFLADVRENSMKHGLVQLQETLLSNLLGEKKVKLGNVLRGISILEHRLRCKKVLLVLDDVDNLNQLRSLAETTDRFGCGSRIIITTRDKHLLITPWVEKIYEVKELDDHEALELLSWNAFKRSEPDPRYMDIAKVIVQYAKGLPLSLNVIGSDLFGKTIEEWKSALKKYERLSDEILKVLKVSYDSLEVEEKQIFLDIACFFNGNLVEDVEKALDASHSFAKIGFRVLIDKSLVYIDETNRVKMHDSIQDLGREITRQESLVDPGKRSRLWHYEDVLEVLAKNTGTKTIEGIMLDMANIKQEVQLRADAFEKFQRLRILIFRNAQFFGGPKACFSEGPKYLSNSLTVLQWTEYPSSCLPIDFHPTKLVILDLQDSCLQSLEPIKDCPLLRSMNLRGSKNLIKMPDFSGFPKLQKLDLEGCTALLQLDPSITILPKLTLLNLRNCKSLISIPNNLNGLNSHERLGRCAGFLKLDPSTAIFPKLTYLNLQNCKSIVSIPNNLFGRSSLETLNLGRCSKLAECLNFNPLKSSIKVKLLSNQHFPFLSKMLCYLFIWLLEDLKNNELVLYCLILLIYNIWSVIPIS